MFPKKGNVFPARNRGGKSRTDYAAAIAVDQSMGKIGDSAARFRQAGAVPFASMAELRSWILRF